MEPHLTKRLRVMFIMIVLLSLGSCENDLDLNFCGIWVHGKGPLSLNVNLSTGCKNILISANESSLTIEGQITSQCIRSDVISLKLPSDENSEFCIYWDPLLDQMKLQVGGNNLILCWPISLQGSCCTDLSNDANEPIEQYGILNGRIQTDTINYDIRKGYKFSGQPINCSKLCDQVLQSNFTKSESQVKNEHVCARRSEVEMRADFKGQIVTSPSTKGTSAAPTAIVHLPPALKQAAKNTNKVVLAFFQNNDLFQEGYKDVRVLNDVVEITVENEAISNLPEPIRITFHHDPVKKLHSRKCVSWDTRNDHLQVNWLEDGCQTQEKGDNHTECLCNHLTYFTVLVQLHPRPVRHLLALTVITSLGCAVSVISCIALIIYLFRKSRSSKEKSTPIHLGLAFSLALLNLLFFLTGVLANIGGESVCTWVAAGLHYALLSSFTWMGIQVFHTFWLVYKVFIPLTQKPYIWNLVGFALPVVPVIVLSALGGIYGIKEVIPSDDVSNPYLMCWMKNTDKAWLAHYFINIPIVIILVLSGSVMLFVVYKQIKTREEWRENRVAFLSIWGLSCLFGTTWGLAFLDFGPLSDFVLFVSCILNSFQGFLLMLRFCMLNWMRKQTRASVFGSNSTGSTRQHMLQSQEKC